MAHYCVKGVVVSVKASAHVPYRDRSPLLAAGGAPHACDAVTSYITLTNGALTLEGSGRFITRPIPRSL